MSGHQANGLPIDGSAPPPDPSLLQIHLLKKGNVNIWLQPKRNFLIYTIDRIFLHLLSEKEVVRNIFTQKIHLLDGLLPPSLPQQKTTHKKAKREKKKYK